jgi:membrane protease YdiL (CAAX protease family)
MPSGIRRHASEHLLDSAVAQKAEFFSAPYTSDLQAQAHIEVAAAPSAGRDLLEIALVLGFILVAVWTPQGPINSFFSLVAAACVVAFALVGRWTFSEMGLTRPLKGTAYILLLGAMACAAIVAVGITLRPIGMGYTVPWERSWQYAIWAVLQEFILQAIFFLRLEALLGSRRAVIAAASLFALVHIPSPLLTVLAFLGGLLFCECFRRWRNLYPVGLIHAALGLTISAYMPDRWLHHMRVGIGYLALHS